MVLAHTPKHKENKEDAADGRGERDRCLRKLHNKHVAAANQTRAIILVLWITCVLIAFMTLLWTQNVTDFIQSQKKLALQTQKFWQQGLKSTLGNYATNVTTIVVRAT